LAQTISFDELDRCLDLITHNGAKTLNVEDQYGTEAGKPANLLVLDAATPFEAVKSSSNFAEQHPATGAVHREIRASWSGPPP
jgi:cytosine deaminase